MISFAVVIITIFIFELKIPKSSIVPISFLHSSCSFLSCLNCFKNMASNHLEIMLPPKKLVPLSLFSCSVSLSANGTCVCAKLLQSCSTLCDPRDYSLSGSTVHGILQARIMEWVAVPSSRGSSQPRDRTWVSYMSCIGRQVLYH